ncbi:MAG: cytochrome oxidase subunit III, partial [Fulvivirga sp.]
MTSDFKIVEEAKRPLSMHPKKFGLWLFMITVVMIFASLTSAYIVRQAEGNWVVFELPMEMWITSVIIAISSISMQMAYFAAKKDNLERVKLLV